MSYLQSVKSLPESTAATIPSTSPPADARAASPWKPEILAFCCNFCAYAAADLAGSRRMQYPSNLRVIHVPCTGKIELEQILSAFERGIDGVLIAGCLEGGCHFIEGNRRAKRRAEHLREMLEDIGIGAERLRMVNLSAAMAPTFVQRVNEIVDAVQKLGPNPLKTKRT